MPVLIVAFAATAAAAPELSAAAIAAIVATAAGGTVTTGGIYYYRKEIYNRITILFRSASDALTLDQLDQLKKDQEETEMRQKQPLIIAEAVVANATTHVHSIVEQTSQQQACIEAAVQDFTETVSNAQDATQTVKTMAQPLHIAAMNAVNHVDVLEHELSHVSENMTLATATLNASNDAVSSIAKHISQTQTTLRETLTQYTDDTSNTKHEIETMKEKIRTLSTHFLAVTRENRALMSENVALKNALFMHNRSSDTKETSVYHDNTNRSPSFN